MKRWAGNILLLLLVATPIWLPLISALRSATSDEKALPISSLYTGALAASTIIAALNAYLSFIRPFFYAKCNTGSMNGYKNISGIPLVGSIIATIVTLLNWGQLPISLATIALALIDTGGPLWLILALTSDKTIWETKQSS